MDKDFLLDAGLFKVEFLIKGGSTATSYYVAVGFEDVVRDASKEALEEDEVIGIDSITHLWTGVRSTPEFVASLES